MTEFEKLLIEYERKKLDQLTRIRQNLSALGSAAIAAALFLFMVLLRMK